jgi:N-acetylmuramoyl-L-alanine amidase
MRRIFMEILARHSSAARCLIAILVFLSGILPAVSASPWKPVPLQGRDYIPHPQITGFYQFETVPQSDEKTLLLRSGRSSVLLEADSRMVVIQGVKHWFSFPVLMRDGVFHISRMDLVTTLEPALRPDRVAGLSGIKTVVLDAGHGGHDRGAHSRFAYEKEFTLDLARRVRDRLLRRGFRVVMTRNRDVFLALERRASMGNRERDSIFVSLHFNSSGTNPLANGVEVFCVPPHGAPPTGAEQASKRDLAAIPAHAVEAQSFSLANAVQHAMVGRLGMTDRGVKRAGFAVLRLSKNPSILVEGGFLSNEQDAKKIANAAWRDRLADAIVDGISSYHLLAERSVPPRSVADYRAGRGVTIRGDESVRRDASQEVSPGGVEPPSEL